MEIDLSDKIKWEIFQAVVSWTLTKCLVKNYIGTNKNALSCFK